MEYTKGEWRFEKSDLTIRSNDFKNGTQMADYKGVIVADLKPALGCDDSDNVDLEHTGRSHAVPQTLANAQLIAAAPEMYEACKLALDFFITFDSTRKVVSALSLQLNEAVAKAEGRESNSWKSE